METHTDQKKTKPFTQPPAVIRDKHIKPFFGFSKSHADRLTKLGLFPKPRKFGPGVVGRLYSECMEAIQNMPSDRWD